MRLIFTDIELISIQKQNIYCCNKQQDQEWRARIALLESLGVNKFRLHNRSRRRMRMLYVYTSRRYTLSCNTSSVAYATWYSHPFCKAHTVRNIRTRQERSLYTWNSRFWAQQQATVRLRLLIAERSVEHYGR